MEYGGAIVFICGCMYSGKTSELLRRVRRFEIARRKVQVFKSHRDTRYYDNAVTSHGGLRTNAIKVSPSVDEPHRTSSKELVNLIEPDSDVIAIDEIQFYDEDIVQVCDDLANSGKLVIVAGLTLDFRGEPFGEHTLYLLAKADELVKLSAVCIVCGRPASMTQRLVNGQPAKWTDPIYMEDNKDTYQAVCRKHHQIDRPPDDQISESYLVLPKSPETW